MLGAAFGPELAATVADLRRAEVARFADSSPQEIVAALRWVF